MNDVKTTVREAYASIATKGSCCCSSSLCCGNSTQITSKKMGYTDDDISSVPDGANLGLGCGNPAALASLKEGEIVLDLGSGAGFDCFLSANKVGDKGKVIGVDMTPEMIEKARKNCAKGLYTNVEFRLGEIENLPVADNYVDVIISNCVINLAPDKPRVFSEAFRVLKPGGRLMISDIVLLRELPDTIKSSVSAYVGCISGAIMKDDYIQAIENAGFSNVQIIDEKTFSLDCMENDPTAQAIMDDCCLSDEDDIQSLVESIRSIQLTANKL